MHKLAVLSTFPPRKCGIASYSNDLFESISRSASDFDINEIELITNLDDRINTKRKKILDSNPESYLKICDYLNSSGVDVVDIQHEFKIFGEPDGEYLNILLENISKPIVSTLHTVNQALSAEREKVFCKLVKRSNAIFVFSNSSKLFIVSKYGIKHSLINVIPHGVPEIEFTNPIYSDIYKNNTEIIFISSGYMRNTKGYDLALEALANIKLFIPNFKYVIVGSNHPRNETAQEYRNVILSKINEFGLSDKVQIIDEYQTQTKLIELIQSANVCLLPYSRKEQSSSGVLALMIACGRPVVVTPFQFATTIVSSKSGIVSNSFSVIDFTNSIESILKKSNLWREIGLYNHNIGKSWLWANVAQKYLNVYRQLISHH
jgi:glycosyltransferase involved in cell wall biosynthesis